MHLLPSMQSLQKQQVSPAASSRSISLMRSTPAVTVPSVAASSPVRSQWRAAASSSPTATPSEAPALDRFLLPCCSFSWDRFEVLHT
jgi:hypothetical protein